MTLSPRAAATPPLLRHLNERTVLEAIREQAPISRAEISRAVGISKPTVSLALRSLLAAGLVREAPAEPGRPNYGATFFEPVPDAALVLGLDFGARFLRGAVCNLLGDVRARQDVELGGADALQALEMATDLTRRLIASCGLGSETIDGAVVGVPGVVAAGGDRVTLAESIPGLEGLSVGSELERRLGVRVRVENDVNLAALGEQWRGVARGVDDFVFLQIGTGLGAGVVLGGSLHRGRNGAAGEVDYALGVGVERESDPCADALSAYAERLATAADGDTVLAPPYDVPSIFAAARARDPLGREVAQEEARRISRHIAPLAAVVDIELVVIGGGIGVNGDLLLAPIRELLDRYLPYPPRVEISSLGDAAVITGALAVGRDAALESVFENRAIARAAT
ncbi:MAG: ROK family protein [Solirubrobacterales bacterium]